MELTDLEVQSNGLNVPQSQDNGLNVLHDQDNGLNVLQSQDNSLNVLHDQENGLNVLQSQAHGIGAHAKCGGSAGRERTNVLGEPESSAVRDHAAAPSDSSPNSSDVNNLQRTDGGRLCLNHGGEGSGNPPLNDDHDDHIHEPDLDQLAGHQDFIQGQEVRDAVRKNSDPSNQVNGNDCFVMNRCCFA